MLAPTPRNSWQIASQLQKKRQIQKQYYDVTHDKCWEIGQVVRMQTTKGHFRLGIMEEVCREPHSYIIQSSDDI